MLTREQLEQAIQAQESLRATLGDTVVDATIAVLREKLAELKAQAPPELRKLVTILFADTVASTAISERLDPEDVLEIMDGALKAYSDAVNEAGGTVARLMGDGLLAFFGAPIGREDDPVRAVRCGLAIVNAARDYARTVEEKWGVSGFDVRVGINTGLVALGEVGGLAGSEWTAMGDAINLAARLQSAAPTGGVLISQDTFIHVRGFFEVRRLEPLTLRGKTEPVTVFLIEREKPRTFRTTTRGVEGVETRMIGREAQLKQLQEIFTWAVDESETQIVTLVGEPGVGKSRLLREFDAWLDELPQSVLHFTGRATYEMLKLPYALIRNMFAFRFDIQESDSAATVRAKLERGITDFLGADSAERAHYIGNLIGFDFSGSPYLQDEEAQQLTQLGVYYITELIGRIAAETPTVIFLDDVHWADDKSLDLINHIVRAKRHLRLMIVCLARPSIFERRSLPWADQDDFHTRIELIPLLKEETRDLVCDILQRVDRIPENLCANIVTTSDGNPFYVEEIIKMLLDDGVIIKGAETWSIDARRLTDLRIPPTLTGVLQARLDALPDAERAVLQRASVVGRIFWDSAVAALQVDGEPTVDHLPDCLTALHRRELIRSREQSAFSGAEEYIFRHNILHDVTYESVLRRLRRVYHAQVADWLINRSGDRINEYNGLIADHYERAGQTGNAVTYLSRAAESALNISAYREAISLVERALALLAEDPETLTNELEARLKEQMAQAYYGLSNFAAAQQLFQESLELYTRAEDSRGIINVLYRLGWLVGSILRLYAEGEQYFTQSLTIARDVGDKHGIAWALNGMGAMAHYQGRPLEAINFYNQSLSIAREIGDHRRTAGALNNLGLVKAELGRFAEARGDLEAALQISRATGNRSGIASQLTNLGNIARTLGEHEEAKQFFDEALSIHEDIGDRSGIAVILWNLGNLARTQGDYRLARERYVQALDIVREIHFKAGYAVILEDLALVARLQGNFDEAQAHLNEVLRVAREVDDQNEVAAALINLGNLARLFRRYAEAHQYLEDSIVHTMQSGNQRLLARSMYYLGDVTFAERRFDAARKYYADALCTYREYDNQLGMALTLGGLGDVAAVRGDYKSARQYFAEAFNIASAIRDTPLTLWILTGIAGLLAKEDQEERSVELLGMVLNHYASPREARDKADAILSELKIDLSSPYLAEALARGRDLAEGADRHRLTLSDGHWLRLLT
jgi:predicted ATPase/class 3 adenylate cyclase